MHGPSGSVVPTAGEPPAIPSLSRGKTVNEKEGWLRRKSFRIEREKDKDKDKDIPATTFPAVRVDKAKNKQDNSTWLQATPLPQIPAKFPNGKSHVPSPISTTGSVSRHSGSSSHRPLPNELRRSVDVPVEGPPVVIKKSSLARPSTAGARLVGAGSETGGTGSNAPPLPVHRAQLDNAQTPRLPNYTPPEKRSPAPHDMVPNTNGNGHRVRASSTHGDVSPSRSKARSSSPRQSRVAEPAQVFSINSKATANGSSSSSSKKSWKRLTGSFLGFVKKDKHRGSG